MKSLFLVGFLATASFLNLHAQTYQWIPINTNSSHNLKDGIAMGNSLILVGDSGKYVFRNTTQSVSVAGQLQSHASLVSVVKMRYKTDSMVYRALSSSGQIYRVDTLQDVLLPDSLPIMPPAGSRPSKLVDLNLSGVDNWRFGYALDSGKILAFKQPYSNPRLEFSLPFQGAVTDLQTYNTWGVLAIGDSGRIWRTAGLDNDFSPVFSNMVTNRLNAIFKQTSSLIWVAGHGGTLLKSTNAGQNWTLEASPSQEDFNSGIFQEGKIFLCGSNGNIMMSDDGGLNWVQESLGTSEKLNKFLAGPDGKLYCLGDGGVLLMRSVVTGNQNGLSFKKPLLTRSSKSWTISNPMETGLDYQILDVSGRLLFEGKVPSSGEAVIPAKQSGLYIIRMVASGFSESLKFSVAD